MPFFGLAFREHPSRALSISLSPGPPSAWLPDLLFRDGGVVGASLFSASATPSPLENLVSREINYFLAFLRSRDRSFADTGLGLRPLSFPSSAGRSLRRKVSCFPSALAYRSTVTNVGFRCLPVSRRLRA